MGEFDPAVATAEYLAQLPPDVLERAAAYTRSGHILILGDWAATTITCAIVLFCAALPSIRARLEINHPRPITATFVVVFAGVLLQSVLQLPWDAYADWWPNGNLASPINLCKAG